MVRQKDIDGCAIPQLSALSRIKSRMIRDDLNRGSSRTYVEKVVLLFIESGNMYYELWVRQ